MPKSKIEFVPIVEVEDDSEDEIEVLPFSKPTPVVIDLLESGSDDSDDSKKSPKKKAKKKKSKRDKEQNSLTDAASQSQNAASSASLSALRRNIPNSASGCGELSTDHVVEPDHLSNEVSGSVCVTGTDSNSAVVNSNGTLALPQITLLEKGSRFEKCSDAQSENAEDTILTDAEMVGTTHDIGKEKRSKSKEKKPRGEGKQRIRKISATQRTNEEIVNFLTTLGIEMEASAFETPTKKRRQSRKRQSAMIEEPAVEPLNNNTASTTSEFPLQNSTDGLPSVAQTAAFVSVTQEDNSPSKRYTKRPRQAIIGDISDFQVTNRNKGLNTLKTNFQSNIIDPSDNSLVNVEDRFTIVNNVENNFHQSFAKIIDDVATGRDKPENFKDLEESNATLDASRRANIRVSSIAAVATEQLVSVGGTPQSSQKSVKESMTSVTSVSPIKKLPEPRSCQKTQSPRVFQEYESPITGLTLKQRAMNDISVIKDAVLPADDHLNPPGIFEDAVVPREHLQDSMSQNLQERVMIEVVSGNEGGRRATVRLEPEKYFSELKLTARCNDLLPGEHKSSTFDSIKSVKNPAQPKLPLPVVKTLSTDDLNSSCFPLSWTTHMKEFYGSIRGLDFELDQVWHTMSESSRIWRASIDLMPPPPNNRFRRTRCDNCKQMGHFARKCTEKRKVPCCIMCGVEGHLFESEGRRRCPESKCLNCGKSQQKYGSKCPGCLLRRHPSRCETCNVIGHGVPICPDNWRRYHSITSQDEYEKAKAYINSNGRPREPKGTSYHNSEYKGKSTMFCCNCGKKGHSYYDCRYDRAYFHTSHRNKPFVINAVQTAVQTGNNVSGCSIPISYDARTGRTVVINANERPGLAVETIQVKIMNDLAVSQSMSRQDLVASSEAGSSLSGKVSFSASSFTNQKSSVKEHNSDQDSLVALSNSCMQHSQCTNKPTVNERCMQTILMKRAHIKLMAAQENGMLKPLEAKHGVQISIISDNNKVHICGSNAVLAEKDLYRYLWSKDASAAQPLPESVPILHVDASGSSPDSLDTEATTNSEGKIESLIVTGIENKLESKTCQRRLEDNGALTSLTTPSNKSGCIPVYTVDDDDDDCCVVAELPVDASARSSETGSRSALADLARSVKESNNVKPNNNPVPVTPSKSEGVSTTSTAYFIDDSPCDGIYTSFESNANFESQASVNNNPAVNENSEKSLKSDDSFMDYESPLTGLSLGILDDKPNAIVRALQSEQFQQNETITNSGVNDNDDVAPSTGMKQYIAQQIELEIRNAKRQSMQQQLKLVLDDSITYPSPMQPTGCDIQIITLDDEDGDTIVNAKELLKVTLLESEWGTVVSEFVRKENIINQISKKFDVGFKLCKESYTISITGGTGKNRQIAKDNIVFWLECKSSDSEFHFLQSGYAELTSYAIASVDIVKPKKSPHKSSIRLRKVKRKALQLQEALIQARRTIPNPKRRINSQISSAGSPSTSNNYDDTTTNYIYDQSSASSEKHLWTPGFNQINFDEDNLPPSQRPYKPSLVLRSPRKFNSNRIKNSSYSHSPRSRFNYHPRKPRYYYNN